MPRGRKARSKPFYAGANWNFNLIQEAEKHCAEIAFEELGFDCYRNQIEIISVEQMLDAYSSHGMPVMYKHWSFGKHFIRNSQMYNKGYMGLAYEIVINSNPCISYLMEENSMTMQTLVIAHAAFGHNHFFKNNNLFREWTDAESILDYLVFAQKFIMKCEEKYGQEAVERTLDACHALQQQGINKYKRPKKLNMAEERERQLNRQQELQEQVNELWTTLPETEKEEKDKKDPLYTYPGEENILYFLEKRAPVLEGWQRELCRITRKLSQYFYPQMQCLTGNHLVSTTDGLLRLDEFIKDEGVKKVNHISLLTDGGQTTPISHTYKKIAKTKIIKTLSGRTYTATPEHPIQILAEDKVNSKMERFENLQVGDFIKINLGYDIFSKKTPRVKYPEYSNSLKKCKICDKIQTENLSSHIKQTHNMDISEYTKLYEYPVSDSYKIKRSKNKIRQNVLFFNNEMSRLFGYLLNFFISDENHPHSTFKYSTESINAANDVQCLLYKLFGIEEIEVFKEYGSYKLSFSSKMLKDLVYLNIPEFKSLRKHEVPKIIRTLPKECMREFIRSYFDSKNSSDSFKRGFIGLKGYSDDYQDLMNWMSILTGFGISAKIINKERHSYQSLCAILGIENSKDVKANDYFLLIPSLFLEKYSTEFGSLKSELPKIKSNEYRPGAKHLMMNVKNYLKAKCKEHTSREVYKKSNYDYKVRNGLLLKDSGYMFLDKFPNLKNKEISINNLIDDELLTLLKNIPEKNQDIILLIKLMENIREEYLDEIISIEDGDYEFVYDVTVPENHLFWCDGLISHNTKVMNEGFASYTHYYIMNRLWEKGLIDDGSYLEFADSHAAVLMQPEFDQRGYSGFNPYALGFAIFDDMKRIATEPTNEDERWFPDLCNTDWKKNFLEAAEDYRDESFILQYLSPSLMRDWHLFSIHDSENNPWVEIEAIHNDQGYKTVRKSLSRMYNISHLLPDIQVDRVSFRGDRTLHLKHTSYRGVGLNKNTMKVLQHLRYLWGYKVVVNSVDYQTNKVISTYTAE